MSRHWRYLGRFTLGMPEIERDPELIANVFAYLKIVVLQADFNMATNKISYLAYCKKFSYVRLAEEAPEYYFTTAFKEGKFDRADVTLKGSVV